MKCPRCGNEMMNDSHRKISLKMCYNCGYIEGRNLEETGEGVSNFAHMKTLNLNELAAFMAQGLVLERDNVVRWLQDEYQRD